MNEDLRLIIQSAVKYARSVANDQEALIIKMLYKEFMAQIGKPLAVGEYVQYGDKLYRVLQAHTAQANWTPDIAASLFVVIDKEHQGILEDPIPAQVNMEYFSGKYYIENNVIYLCTRDSGIALQHMPSALVGSYFEIV